MIRSIGASSKMQTALFGMIAVMLVVMIISFPDQAFQASLKGLTIWWDFVFPALLPFFILSEILLGLGVVHGIGVLLDPLMRLLFRLPGTGGWVVAASVTAGFPAGAKAAVDLRRNGELNAEEGERLVALSHWSSPIFITSVVAAGFWNRPELGLPLAAIHLLSALITGMIIGRVPFHNRKAVPSAAPAFSVPKKPTAAKRSVWRQAVAAMANASRQDGRPLGKMLGDAVASAVQSLMVIGGLMIIFSVLLEMLTIAGFSGFFEGIIWTVFSPFQVPRELISGIIASLFEIHLGLYLISQSVDSSPWAAALLSGSIAWGGVSLHAQVKSFTSGTDLRYRPFAAARLLHAIVSVLIAFLCWNPLARFFSGWSPAFAAAPAGGNPAAIDPGQVWPQLLPSFQLFTFLLVGSILISSAVSLFQRVLLAKGLLDDRRH